MQRRMVHQRENWREKFDELGFSFHSVDGHYWNEGVCYQFTSSEIDHFEDITGELHALCLKAVDFIISNDLFEKLAIPEHWVPYIKESWRRAEPTLYGRFDFSYDGISEPKLLEYNADTPTSLVESSIAQWVWLEEMFPQADQFNSIHEKLLDAFTAIRPTLPINNPLFFTCVKDHEEDFVTIEYLRDIALQTGIEARHIYIEDIGYDASKKGFCDLAENPIKALCKLYPWEWLLSDEFGIYVPSSEIRFFEPAWKLLLSNKGILPILWQIAPNHPNLLPASFERSRMRGDVVRKPIFSREGANITLETRERSYRGVDANYGDEGFIYQEAHPLPLCDGYYPVIGSWIINGLPAGLGIREDTTPITGNNSLFVPHFFIP